MNTGIIEIFLFKTNEGVNSAEFQAEMKQGNKFLEKQKGFVSRKLAVSADGQYLDVTYWADYESYRISAEEIEQNAEAKKLFDNNVEKIDSKTMYNERFEVCNETLTEAREATAIEIILLKTNDGINQSEFRKEINKFDDFLLKQKEFVSRILATADDGQYVDVACWTDLEIAKIAFGKMMQEPFVENLESMIDSETESVEYFKIFDSINQ